MEEKRTGKLKEAIKKALEEILGENLQFSKEITAEELHKKVISSQENSDPESFSNMCRELHYLIYSKKLSEKLPDTLLLFAAHIYKISPGLNICTNRRKIR